MDDLDTATSGLDESDAPTGNGSNKGLIYLALCVGLAGVAVGVTGIYLANAARKEVATFRAELSATPSATAADLSAAQTAIQTKLDDMEGRLGNMGGSIVRLQRQGPSADLVKQLQDLHTQTQNAFNAVSEEVRANRTQLNELSGKLQELGARRGSSASVASTSTATPAPTGGDSDPAPTAAPLEVPEGATVHTVQPGENMSVIARRYNVTLTALMAANPTIEPRRMMPGDRVVIPPAN